MAAYLWKHLPYAIYLDTNALRSAGSNLDAPWINELLSITNEYGIAVCISELVLAEWCEHIVEVLEGSKQKLLSSIALLRHYGVSVPDIKPNEIRMAEKAQLAGTISGMMKVAGFDIIPNWDAPLFKLLDEAVTKKPPFEKGGKGLCDAVILESYADHAKANFAQSRVLVISNDSAVRRSEERFRDRDIIVDFVKETEIVGKLKSLLSDEIATYIESKKSKLKAFILSHEPEILAFIRETPLEITDWMLNPPYPLLSSDSLCGSVESILSINPTRITDVIGGAPTYGEEIAHGRYPVRISVEVILEVSISEYGLGLASLGQTRAIVQPDLVDNKLPVILERKSYDWGPREITKTILRTLTVFATLDEQKEKDDVYEGLKIEKVV